MRKKASKLIEQALWKVSIFTGKQGLKLTPDHLPNAGEFCYCATLEYTRIHNKIILV